MRKMMSLNCSIFFELKPEVERIMIEQQLRFMQSRVQLVLSGWCFVASPPSCWLGLFFGLVCLVLLGLSVLSVLRFALVGFASRQLTEVTEDGRVLSTLQY